MYHIDVVKEAMDRANASGSEADRASLFRHLNVLISMGSAEADFAGLARFFIKRFMRANNLGRPGVAAAANG
jgi:hypothetical protein